jgi:hypothetical protein
LNEFILPNQDDVQKQMEEILQLLQSPPIPTDVTGGPEIPTIQIDMELDNHVVEAATTRKWLISPAGRDAKVSNPEGYLNVLLHFKAHTMAAQPPLPDVPNQPQQPQVPAQDIVNEDGQNGIDTQFPTSIGIQ